MYSVQRMGQGLLIGLFFVLVSTVAGCTAAQPENSTATENGVNTVSSNGSINMVSEPKQSDTHAPESKQKSIQMHIGNQTIQVRLADTVAAEQFVNQLPQTLTLQDVNDNEKYIVLNTSFTTDSKVAGTIKAGQLKLWGHQGLVLFYKNFDSSYAYTDLGEVVDPVDWETLLGKGTVTITFSK
ncbi:cyclophilin-like fold protein [Veillonella criceti]|uniref:Uncharacterized conserved protein n=1 Tax=Veillonella criceti TaxID=103891 RepID=A0A380NMT2_9FIRM|nr:cyclophilin-like fold protein [Veillonella criceti]SUP43268.1 Uncharacterized conserved protein [Veillonella criceti]